MPLKSMWKQQKRDFDWVNQNKIFETKPLKIVFYLRYCMINCLTKQELKGSDIKDLKELLEIKL